MADFARDLERENAALVAALNDTLRIMEAVKLSAGLGKSQLARLDKAKAALALARQA